MKIINENICFGYSHSYVNTAPYDKIRSLFYDMYDNDQNECIVDFSTYDYDREPFIPQQIIDLANLEK